MSAEISDKTRRQVAERAYHVCEYCLVHEADLFHGCEVDHIISVKHKGKTELENLAYACFRCNRHKGSDLGSLAPATGKLTRFFNPRSDSWPVHFSLDGGRIEPLTDIGEVTVQMFDLNRFDRVRQRELLAKAGRYPSIEALARMKE
jgi:HNH endonuclease